MRYFCLHTQDATKHLPGLPSHFPSQMLCWQPRSGPHLWVSRAPISCLNLSQGISRWFSHKLQTKVRLVFNGESRNGFSILTIGGHLDARCFIPQPSLPSLCIFQLALKSAFKLTHRFWPSLYQAAKSHQRSLAPRLPQELCGQSIPNRFLVVMMRRKQLRNEAKWMQRQEEEWGEELSAKNREKYWGRRKRWGVWD